MPKTDISPIVNTEAIREWVAALRSGEYRQGNSYLKYISPFTHEFSYCCLGVACDLFAERAGVIRGNMGENVGDFDDSTQYMSNTMIAFLGVEGSSDGEYGNNGELCWTGVNVKIPPHLREECLAHEGGDDCEPNSPIIVDLTALNDSLLWDFNKIADCIEYTYLHHKQTIPMEPTQTTPTP